MNLTSLEEIHQAIWKKLEHSVRQRNSAWHLAVLGTVRAGKPELRNLVLRGALPEKNMLWMHTDLRSPKCQDLKNCSSASLLFYDSLDRWQLRLNGTIQLDSDSESTETTWKKVSASAKRCYQGPFAPGTRSAALSHNLPQKGVSEAAGRENFTRLLFFIEKMDWLFLQADGHLRAQWNHQQDGLRTASWVNP